MTFAVGLGDVGGVRAALHGVAHSSGVGFLLSVDPLEGRAIPLLTHTAPPAPRATQTYDRRPQLKPDPDNAAGGRWETA